jgi:hypothetical protein
MGRTHLELLLNFAVVLYLVTHGVSVPAEGQADLVTGFYHATRGWLDAQLAPIRSLLGSVNLARA